MTITVSIGEERQLTGRPESIAIQRFQISAEGRVALASFWQTFVKIFIIAIIFDERNLEPRWKFLPHPGFGGNPPAQHHAQWWKCDPFAFCSRVQWWNSKMDLLHPGIVCPRQQLVHVVWENLHLDNVTLHVINIYTDKIYGAEYSAHCNSVKSILQILVSTLVTSSTVTLITGFSIPLPRM